MSDLTALLVLVGAAIALLYGIGRALKKREERWESDDWRRKTPTIKVGNALLEIQSLVDPGARAALEERQRERKEEEGEGDPPTAGDSAV